MSYGISTTYHTYNYSTLYINQFRRYVYSQELQIILINLLRVLRPQLSIIYHRKLFMRVHIGVIFGVGGCVMSNVILFDFSLLGHLKGGG